MKMICMAEELQPIPDSPVEVYDKPVWTFAGKLYKTEYLAMFAKAKQQLYTEEWNKWVQTSQTVPYDEWVKRNWREYEYNEFGNTGFAYNEPTNWNKRIHERTRQLLAARLEPNQAVPHEEGEK